MEKIRKQRLKSRNAHKVVTSINAWKKILKLPWKEQEMYCLQAMMDASSSEIGPMFTDDMVIICDYPSVESGVTRINVLLRLFQLNFRLSHVNQDSKPGRPVYKMMHFTTELVYCN